MRCFRMTKIVYRPQNYSLRGIKSPVLMADEHDVGGVLDGLP